MEILYFNTIQELIDYQDPINNQLAVVKSYTGQNTFGGGNFAYDSTLANELNGVSLFKGWVRINVTHVDPFMAGAKGDNISDDSSALEKSLIYARELKLALKINGVFATSKALVLQPWDTVLGEGRNVSRIRKVGNSLENLAARQAPEKPVGTLDNYNVDACLIFYPWDNGYADSITVKDIYFSSNDYADNKGSTYGLYAPRHAKCVTENLQFDNVRIAFYAKNLYLNKHTNFTSIAGSHDNLSQGRTGMVVYDGEDTTTGTSNTFERFLFVNYDKGFEISNLQTSKFICCYGEQIKKNKGYDDTQTFIILNPYNLILDCCGQESSYGTPLYITSSPNAPEKRTIEINGFQARWGTNGTLDNNNGLNLVTVIGSDLEASFNSCTFIKGNEGFINDFLYIAGGAKVYEKGCNFGTLTPQVTPTSQYLSLTSSYLTFTNSGVSQPTKIINDDLNKGVNNTSGILICLIQGATENIPSGIDSAWGTSVYYGLNSTQGTQVLYLTNSNMIWKRTKLSSNNQGLWEPF
ncbi:hypothetical protein J0904_02175 [Acinetobacter bereziniae]|uniref:hypothetical protein n=1 Tax=Acinetobacter bereziniae TaxID=106648 RepID=UPI002074F5DB|nr:hypothetical protein [Acinetobacter bereziniae]MCM8510895.1 hypothetical protein [Acinetobacter bereziniae]